MVMELWLTDTVVLFSNLMMLVFFFGGGAFFVFILFFFSCRVFFLNILTQNMKLSEIC